MGKVWASLAVVGALALANPLAAATVVLNTGGTNATTSTKTFTGDDGTQLKVTAFTIDAGGIIRSGTLGQYDGGLGIQYTGDDSHTVDNIGRKDFFLLFFNKTVEAGQATFTTNYNFNNGNCCLGDTDATIGANTFGGVWNGDLSYLIGQNQSVLSSFGLYSSDSTSTSSTQTRDINPLDRTGNIWLVGASFSDTTPNDGFKFKTLKYTVAPPPVPEPSTWALLILGFGGVGATMRRRKQPAVAVA